MLKKIINALETSATDKSSLSILDKRTTPRSSGLPYCAILRLLDWIEIVQTPYEFTSFADRFYFDIGTSVHTMWQASIANHPKYGKRVWGNWKCPACGKEEKHRFRPELCDCGAPVQWEYVEISLRYRGITGHCDHVSRYHNVWTIGDLKTASVNALNSKRTNLFPYKKHPFQLRSYGVMLNEMHGIMPEHLILIYQSREIPDLRRYVPIAWNQKIYDKTKKELDRTADSSKVLTQVKKGKLDLLPDLIDLRPCTSLSTYEERMSAKFEWENGPCPLLKYCASNSCHKKLLPKLERALGAALEKTSKRRK